MTCCTYGHGARKAEDRLTDHSAPAVGPAVTATESPRVPGPDRARDLVPAL
ncbi:hypothetical protein GCM10010393_57880 [Streptomyces gobitricini]|uniref:Uncharacterized protein n=1 Tax=Streptomyces gobitricini TaxID=68211 RepID=A0ABP6AK42_9ACTN